MLATRHEDAKLECPVITIQPYMLSGNDPQTQIFIEQLFWCRMTAAFFYVVRTVHFGMKLYNDQRNAQVFNLFINLLLPYMFRAFF
jgi:hypothetical protein